MTKKQNKIKNIVIDAQGKTKGIPEHMIKKLDSAYRMIEELCVSAHALSIHKEMIAMLSDKDRDDLTRLCNKVADMLPVDNPQARFVAMEIMFVNTYSRLFDMGVVNIFNEVKMERETIAKQIHNIRKGEQTPTEPVTKSHSGVEVA